MSTRPILEQEFTNHFGQVIKPGDTVIAIASGYGHDVTVRLGTYIGLRRSQSDGIEHVVVAVSTKKQTTRNTCLPGKRIYPSTVPLSL